ncbi:MAG: glycosyltransferase family 2 protein [Anaerolineales bacterium]|nr:glycosyltransferase family 2 protein [Anaerolineales bacterium]
MNTPKVSVLIPTYNGADFLGEAIQSVLGQTYPDVELIIVDDASPDHTAEVVRQFDDPRLTYIVHPENRGADVARHTALQASSGELVAFLDQDDFFHPEKLQAHVVFFEGHPDVGFTYNARFELNYSATTIRDLWRPPHNISLADLVLWFPLAPSDVVLRRKWAQQMDLIGGRRGAEIAHFGRLFLAGCKFAYVDRALNYRRYHSGRIVKDLAGACQSELNNQVKVFTDPHCPPELLALRHIAHANLYMYWAYLAFAQNETGLGQEFIRQAARLKPSILEGVPSEVVTHFLVNCIDDESQNHESLLQKVFAQLPPEMARLSEQYSGAAAQGYLLKGARAVIWNRPADGRSHFERAASLGAQVDESFLSTLTHQLLNYEAEFGAEAAQDIFHALAPYLEKLGGRASVRRLNGSYSVNRAFHSYRAGEYAGVPTTIWQAIANDPKYLTNRGVLSILLRSSVGRWAKLG